MFLTLFCSIFDVAFLFLLTINIQNYKYDALLMGKLRLVLFSICTIITVIDSLHSDLQSSQMVGFCF